MAPKFHLGYSIVAGMAGAQALGVIGLKHLGARIPKDSEVEE